jgi:hypothetical protein
MIGIAKKLLERTNSIQPDSTRVAARGSESPRTSPGRLLAAQSRLAQAESEGNVAEVLAALSEDKGTSAVIRALAKLRDNDSMK